MLSLDESNWLVCAALAAPHALYAFIWFFPRTWQAVFKKRSVEAFETVAWLLKSESRGRVEGGACRTPLSSQRMQLVPAQAADHVTDADPPPISHPLPIPLQSCRGWPCATGICCAARQAWTCRRCRPRPGWWAWRSWALARWVPHAHVWVAPAGCCQPGPSWLPPRRHSARRALTPLSAPCVRHSAQAQWLNIGIFRAIGHPGVYYGFKLGHTIPWVDGFPFNVVSHPQYVGSVATLLGAAAIVSWLVAAGRWLAGWLAGCLHAGWCLTPECVCAQGLVRCWQPAPAVRARACSLHERLHRWHPTAAVADPFAPAMPEQVWTQAPAGLGLLAAYWTGLYAVTAFQESKLHVE